MATSTVKKSSVKKSVTVKKTVVKAKAKTVEAKTTEVVKVPKVEKLPTSLKITVLDTAGVAAGSMTLPEALFGVDINKQLIAQSVRAYRVNQRAGSASTKTRGQVAGSTRKIYRQKGTGRARHGGIRAPIFVGGGVAFGPNPTDFHMNMPQKMRRQALASALTWQHENGHLIVIDGLAKLESKTKLMAGAMIAVSSKPQTLLVVNANVDGVVRAARNLATVDVLPVMQLNAYAVATHATIVFMKEAVSTAKDVFTK